MYSPRTVPARALCPLSASIRLIVAGVAFVATTCFGADAVTTTPAKPAETSAGTGDASPPTASPALDPYKLSLKELMNVRVSTISRVDEKIDEAPGSVYVFCREDIRKRGYRSLGELLETVPGFTVFHRDLQFVAGVRGLNANDNEKITLLINGQNLNGVDEPDYLNGPINLDNVERVEVVVGPSSFFQQANTLAATVNVITRQVQGVEITAATGTSMPYSGTVSAGKRWGPQKWISFSYTSEHKDGWDAFHDNFRPNLAGRDLAGKLEQPNLFSVLKGQYEDVSGQIVAYRTKLPELLIDNGARTNDAHLVDQVYSAFLKHEHEWSSSLETILRLDAAWKSKTRINEDHHPIDGLQTSVKQWAYTGDMGIRYKGFSHHMIQAGIQGSFEHDYDTYYTLDSEEQSIGKTTLVHKDTFGLGFYADDEYQVNSQLKLIGGVRLDKNTRLDGDRWYPGARAAIVGKPFSNWVTKLLYNRAVRMPSPLAALNENWGINNPNPPDFAALARTAYAPEILSTEEWQNIFYVNKVRVGVTLYHEELEDFISWFEPHTNVGNFKGNGVELNVTGKIQKRLSVWGNAAFNKSELNVFQQFQLPAGAIEQHHAIVDQHGRIAGAPELTANIGFNYDILKNLTFSPTLRYFTEQTAYDFERQQFEKIRNRYYIDATVYWRKAGGHNLDVSLSARNIFDNQMPVGGQWLRDTYRPRGVEAVLSVTFRF